jgi:hypothetical protein
MVQGLLNFRGVVGWLCLAGYVCITKVVSIKGYPAILVRLNLGLKGLAQVDNQFANNQRLRRRTFTSFDHISNSKQWTRFHWKR